MSDMTDMPADAPDRPLHAPLPRHPEGELLQLVQQATTHAGNAHALYQEGSHDASDAALVSIASSLAYIAESMAKARLDDAQEEADRLAFCWGCREDRKPCQQCGVTRAIGGARITTARGEPPPPTAAPRREHIMSTKPHDGPWQDEHGATGPYACTADVLEVANRFGAEVTHEIDGPWLTVHYIDNETGDAMTDRLYALVPMR